MPGYRRIKACFWLFLFLTVCPVTFIDEIAASNAIIPFRNCCQKTGLTESITQAVERYLEKRKECHIWNVISSVLDVSYIVLLMDSATKFYLQGFLLTDFVKLISAAIWRPVLMTPIEKEIAPAVLEFDKMYLTKFWSYLNLRKEEEKVVLPPPEESLLDKMANRILPGTNMKSLLNYLKKMLESIRESTGYSLYTIVSIIILSVITSKLITQLYDYLTDVPEEKDFTDEELMEEYDYTPEFRDALYEWLTPTRNRKYRVEDDEIMDTRDSTGCESDESDYWLTP